MFKWRNFMKIPIRTKSLPSLSQHQDRQGRPWYWIPVSCLQRSVVSVRLLLHFIYSSLLHAKSITSLTSTHPCPFSTFPMPLAIAVAAFHHPSNPLRHNNTKATWRCLYATVKKAFTTYTNRGFHVKNDGFMLPNKTRHTKLGKCSSKVSC